MTGLLLSAAEIHDLTGAVRRRKQLAWFTERGIRAELGNDNCVKVLREAVDRHMLPGQGRGAVRRQGPDLSALRKTG